MQLPLRLKLALIALVLAGLLVVVGNVAADLAVGRRPLENGRLGFIDAQDVAIIHLVLTGMPFFTLALCADPRRKLWIAAVALTLACWGYATWQIWRDSLNEFAGGANIGLGLIMMAVPLLGSVVLAVVSIASRRRAE